MINKILFVCLMIITSCSSEKNYNLPDIEDTNRVPAHLENRRNEFSNAPDTTDPNKTPAGLEERAEEEERIKVYDDPLF